MKCKLSCVGLKGLKTLQGGMDIDEGEWPCVTENYRGDRGLYRAEEALSLSSVVQVAVSPAESQRDSAPKPRVARNELPWVRDVGESNPERVAARGGRKTQPGHNPVGVVGSWRDLPRVARSSQPWALLRNPFGIENVPACGPKIVHCSDLNTAVSLVPAPPDAFQIRAEGRR